MPQIKIITDSAADLPTETARKYGIGIVPLLVSFPEKTYADGVDLTPDQFYQKLKRAPRLPVTSQPSPQDFIDAFQPELEKGNTVIAITLSSALSGTYDSARLACDALDESGRRIHLVDSLGASNGEGLLVLLAARMAAEGSGPSDIILAVQEARRRLTHLFTLDTMENLVKGGRIGKAKGTIGDLLNIKPVLYIDDAGKIDLRDKVRGSKKALRYLASAVTETAGLYGLFAVSHANRPDEAEELSNNIRQRFPEAEVLIGTIGATIGTHTGEGCLALFYFA